MKRFSFKALAFLMIFSILFGSLPALVSASVWENSVTMYLGSPMAGVNGELRFIDPNDYNIAPVLREDRVMAPLAFIGEALEGEVSVSGSSQKLKIGEKTLTFQSNSNTAELLDKNERKKHTLSTEAVFINNRFYIPLRSTADILGKEYFYDKGLIVISDIPDAYRTTKDRLTLDALIEKVNNLPLVGTEEDLISLVGKPSQWIYDDEYDSIDIQASNKTVITEAATSGAASDYSQTNIQVQGVDEGDKIKTDGRFIYYAGTDTVSVIQAVPADGARILTTITFPDENFQSNELYLDGSTLAIIGQSFGDDYKPQTLIYLYDVSNPTKAKQLKKTVVDGSYDTSRRIGSHLYVVSNANLRDLTKKDHFVTPSYTDLDKTVSLGFEGIRYFPELCSPVYTLITGIAIDHPSAPIEVRAYFGGEGKLYVSEGNMYMAVADSGYNSINAAQRGYTRNETRTNIYKFSLLQGKTRYVYKANIPGLVLNQFSMDETEGYFRIATTAYTPKGETTNGLYVFNESGELTGKIEGIAVGERIYSVRYTDKRAYMVTFKNTDPLFVIDLRDLKKPVILGALKIPGYSNYLHPYDENHIIGIGKDTVESGGIAYDKGMKVALFDITDVENPKEKFVTYIGERGTNSPLLTNHKAILFSRERNTLAFPVSVVEKIDGYDQFTFQGAYVYDLTLNRGFNLKGKITHMDDEDYLAAGLYSGAYSLAVDRIMYIGNYFYTFSQNLLKVTANTTYGEVSRAILP